MSILDNAKKMKKFDSKGMLESLMSLSQQVKEIGSSAKELSVPAEYGMVENAVVFGMGGSALGAHIIKSLYFNKLKLPLEIVNGYKTPEYVGPKTLAIISSYSGTTEEALSDGEDALARDAKVAVITHGGTLKDWAQKNQLPALVFETKNNPCGSPRIGLGYSIVGQMMLFAKAGILDFEEKEIETVVSALEKYTKKFGPENPESENLAKQLAQKIKDRAVWYLASEHLSGNAHAAANQINENAKRFGGYFVVPEMNHHLMEGMLNPKSNRKNLCFLLLISKLYDVRIQKRYEVIKKVFNRTGIKFLEYSAEEKDGLSQVCEILSFSSFLSFYLAIGAKIDPTDIPFVDFFKEELKK